MGPSAASQEPNADNHDRPGASLKWASALAPRHPGTKQQAGRTMRETFMVSLPGILRTPQEKTDLQGTEQGEIIPCKLAALLEDFPPYYKPKLLNLPIST